jgi:hypothetical protein
MTNGQRNVLLGSNGMLISRMQQTIPEYIEAGITNPREVRGTEMNN